MVQGLRVSGVLIGILIGMLIGMFPQKARALGVHESSAGILATSGNARASSFHLKHQSEFQMDSQTLQLRGSCLTASSRGVESARFWDFGVRLTRKQGPRFSVFLGEWIEGNRFLNLLQRYSTDAGAGYSFEKNGWAAASEAGYRFSRENYPYGFREFHFVRILLGVERRFSKSVSAKFGMEVLPNLTLWQAYQVNSEIALSAWMSEVFSLKSSYSVRYYNAPPAGAVYPIDSAFTTSLGAKF